MKAHLKRLRSGHWEIRYGDYRSKLTPVESGILWLLMCRNRISRDEVIAQFWPNPNVEPEWVQSSIGVRICNLRRKLAPAQIYISNSYNFGWRLEMGYEPTKLHKFSQFRTEEAMREAA